MAEYRMTYFHSISWHFSEFEGSKKDHFCLESLCESSCTTAHFLTLSTCFALVCT